MVNDDVTRAGQNYELHIFTRPLFFCAVYKTFRVAVKFKQYVVPWQLNIQVTHTDVISIAGKALTLLC